MTTDIQKHNVGSVRMLKELLDDKAPAFMQVAPKHLKVERLLKLLVSAAMRNPKILQCTQESVLNFCMKCSETGLEPIGAGGAWPIPYGSELTFIPDYRGLVNCAKRGGCIKDAYAETVREKDEFYYELGMTPVLVHKPARGGERGRLQSAYCIMTFPDDTKRFVVMDAEEIAAIRKRSKSSSNGPWVADESEMWKKTVMRRAMKPFAGASPELDVAIESDDAVNGVLEQQREPVKMPTAIAEEPHKRRRKPKELPAEPVVELDPESDVLCPSCKKPIDRDNYYTAKDGTLCCSDECRVKLDAN